MVSFIKHKVLFILSAIIVIVVSTRITDSNGDHEPKALTIYRNPDLLDPGNKFCIVDFHPRRKFLKVNSYQYHTYSIILDTGDKFYIVDFHPKTKFLTENSYQYHTYSIILDLPKSQAYNK